MFSIGYEVAREEKQRAENRQEEFGRKLWDFFIVGDGEEAEVNILNALPVNWYRHTIKEIVNGRETFRSYVCTGQPDCPGCLLDNRASYVGSYLVVDRRKTESGGQTYQDQIRLYTQGVRVTSNLDRIHTRYGGLNNWRLIITRIGKGTNTTYNIERDVEERFTEKEMLSLMDEEIKNRYLELREKVTLYETNTEDIMQQTILMMIQDQLETFHMFPEVKDQMEEDEYQPQPQAPVDRELSSGQPLPPQASKSVSVKKAPSVKASVK